MTLTTHAVAGALIGAVAYHNPAFAVVAAILSHPLLDAIPHWDYSLSSGDFDENNPMENSINTSGKKFLTDLMKIGFDFCAGLVIVAIMFRNTSWQIFAIAFICALCAIAPDPLQFVYWKTRSKIIEPFQRFHMYLHAKTKLTAWPVLGILCQAVIILILLFCIRGVI